MCNGAKMRPDKSSGLVNWMLSSTRGENSILTARFGARWFASGPKNARKQREGTDFDLHPRSGIQQVEG
jgi:hypothetical protein